MKIPSLLVWCVLLLISCQNRTKTTDRTIVQKIALANGLEKFETIEELQYTFNVEVNDSLRTSRKWIWSPKKDLVQFVNGDSIISYHQDNAAQYPEIDQKFINDQYWLLFPYHLVWDKMSHDHKEEAIAPISGKQMQELTVTYPSGAGYTPGDVYKVYFGQDYIIREWTYLSGGSTASPFSTTWEQYKDFEGISLAQVHQSADRNFKLYFSDIKVK